ncbi:ANTAR domain-containing protein [Nocardiopsis gilva YIM 90087]|uniref:ANTAR domain-containing protein n=1 Tax=Nocardiopsis gilva YIM 90087 TaxID=1235441 RepID=A0A223S2I2_9ACTN|nr:GAF and ANTAR domain-containing protein [Nocardiopsis gilva]ASU82334.1 ANTAR domain-containing protein [Nocardiopsis gilva YIM 90087]
MWIERLARDIGDLGQRSPERALDQMSMAAARGVPGCSAALVVIWREVAPGDEPTAGGGQHVVVDYGASHSDLATAFEYQYTTDEGPTVAAVREMRAVTVGDVLREDRWPGYTSMAVQCGDRSSVTFPSELEGEVVTFGVHSGRAGVFDDAVVTPLVALLAEHAAMALHSAGRYSDVEREAAHMRRAMSARAVIDQAKGIIMHARGCDAAEAFAELRKVAQRNRLKVVEVARSLVAEHAETNAKALG